MICFFIVNTLGIFNMNLSHSPPVFRGGDANLFTEHIGKIVLVGKAYRARYKLDGFRSVFKHMNRNYTNSQDKYPDYYAYSEGKKAKRKEEGTFIWIWLSLSIILIVLGVILDATTRKKRFLEKR